MPKIYLKTIKLADIRMSPLSADQVQFTTSFNPWHLSGSVLLYILIVIPVHVLAYSKFHRKWGKDLEITTTHRKVNPDDSGITFSRCRPSMEGDLLLLVQFFNLFLSIKLFFTYVRSGMSNDCWKRFSLFFVRSCAVSVLRV